jgi:ferrous iron transport protein A
LTLYQTSGPIRPARLQPTPIDFPMPNTETLDQIPRGQFVLVVDVVGDDPIAHRLNDLGIREGVRIEVIRRAPLGDPTVFELCGYQLCLRRTESERVRVSPFAETSDSTTDSICGPSTQTANT